MPRGRPFQKGNPGGPGRPKRAVEQSYLDVTVASVSAEDWRKVVLKAVKQTQAGDHRARDWLGRMLVGTDPIPLTTLVEELQEALRGW
jgi:hypothetical protein